MFPGGSRSPRFMRQRERTSADKLRLNYGSTLRNFFFSANDQLCFMNRNIYLKSFIDLSNKQSLHDSNWVCVFVFFGLSLYSKQFVNLAMKSLSDWYDKKSLRMGKVNCYLDHCEHFRGTFWNIFSFDRRTLDVTHFSARESFESRRDRHNWFIIRASYMLLIFMRA